MKIISFIFFCDFLQNKNEHMGAYGIFFLSLSIPHTSPEALTFKFQTPCIRNDDKYTVY